MGEAQPKRRATIMEVAQMAGVSHQTVSRYFRANAGMKQATRERIRDAVADLNYRPNLAARAMRGGRTGRLGVLLPSGTSISSLEVLHGATSAAHAAGYVADVIILDGVPDVRRDRAVELVHSGLFDGLVSFTPLDLGDAADGGSPITVLPVYDHELRSIGGLADGSTIADIITALAAMGHRTFMHLGGDYRHTSARSRRDTYEDTIKAMGLESYGVVDCEWSAEAARGAVAQLPEDSGVTAIIGADDVLAAGAIRGALDRGWRVPDDVSVTGWDNNRVAAAMAPSLTTVAVDHERLGSRGMSELLVLMRSGALPEPEGTLTTVVWRESTAPPRRLDQG
ncbi:LacI family DNA-binding transcriptional regulator [Paenarthrobacter sp. NPDC058040]|uniref:LacI family DNA-binding transcriptional regulator n=1 Tax=unclassified Paenarthrobacter TaxID=2634190 RepID=UPI0036DDB8E6